MIKMQFLRRVEHISTNRTQIIRNYLNAIKKTRIREKKITRSSGKTTKLRVLAGSRRITSESLTHLQQYFRSLDSPHFYIYICHNKKQALTTVYHKRPRK